MSRYARCPGENCTSKVKIIEVVPEPEVNFCCIRCWEYTWQMMFSEDGHDPTEHRDHSRQCWERQSARLRLPVVEGEFKVCVPRTAPPSRLGARGGPQVPEVP